ncbi:hypothetical protein JAAARDRAFT_75519 [Jaapia argillacea MUCL 33604]|uniref:F-box domain-containing protein n=1 Tax=Jaapia argillacea MUCL 33604 TaxID=933084 RepID=A0A067QJV2_9AGAM|nr:hypothetical protein JAAARDRAFT_75519 [Jaapia argillacea MUCL 33604]
MTAPAFPNSGSRRDSNLIGLEASDVLTPVDEATSSDSESDILLVSETATLNDNIELDSHVRAGGVTRPLGESMLTMKTQRPWPRINTFPQFAWARIRGVPPASIFRLQDQLLFLILSHLPYDSIFSLLFVSYRLHVIVFHVLFEYHELDKENGHSLGPPDLSTLSIRLTCPPTFQGVKLLCISPCVTALESLHCYFDKGTKHSLPGVLRLVRRMSYVHEASLYFTKEGLQEFSPQSLLQLLGSLSKKKTTSLYVWAVSCDPSTFEHPSYQTRISSKAPPLRSLISLDIGHPSLLMQPLLNWTIETMKLSPIKHLYLNCQDFPPSFRWSHVLSSLPTRNLDTISIRFASLRYRDLAGFLLRHNNISSLEFSQCNVTFDSTIPEPPFPTNHFAHLISVQAEATTISHLISNPASIPQLQYFTIRIPQPESMNLAEDLRVARELAGTLRLVFERIRQRRRYQSVTLIFQGVDAFSSMITNREGADDGSLWPDFISSILIFPNFDQVLCFDSMRSLMPQALRFFPSLVSFVLYYHHFISDQGYGLIQSIADVCPSILRINVGITHRQIQRRV